MLALALPFLKLMSVFWQGLRTFLCSARPSFVFVSLGGRRAASGYAFGWGCCGNVKLHVTKGLGRVEITTLNTSWMLKCEIDKLTLDNYCLVTIFSFSSSAAFFSLLVECVSNDVTPPLCCSSLKHGLRCGPWLSPVLSYKVKVKTHLSGVSANSCLLTWSIITAYRPSPRDWHLRRWASPCLSGSVRSQSICLNWRCMAAGT